MPYITTLQQQIEFVGVVLPNTLLEATLYAIDVGVVAATRGGVPYVDTLQEVAACKPELLDWPASLVIYEAGREKGGMIFLEGDTQALFLFHSIAGEVSQREYRPSVGQTRLTKTRWPSPSVNAGG